ncbi:TonB-dependent receptor [Algoriphagus sp. H41]|uniref:TonB-dependent receptor n=2 Tax=Algoriphagus oliviformis TaxID=2811231 RepID=A0ABS3C9Y7_9BACT|nr:TonB-dependent receptor [Algoriphagus oliviformis]
MVFLLGAALHPIAQAQPLDTESGVTPAGTYQQKQVKGVVSDETGQGMPGATVLEKGTTNGTVTGADGEYQLTVADDAVLVFSFIGYKTLEIPVGESAVVNALLALDDSELDEVVVVGYGTRTRGELTGSVSTVNSDDIARSSTSNLSKSLAGKVPGLIVADRGGYPGTDQTTFLIRGTSTLNNNAPLIILDGVPTANFSFLAPGDIESITVLKDAAAAIYGARAANGVILVTTKRGKEGKAVVNFTTSNQWGAFTRVPQMMNSEQYAIYKNEVNERNGNPAEFSQEEIAKYAANNDPINYPNTDWYDLTMRDYSFETRNSLSISGAAKNVRYFVSGNQFNQGGLFESGDLNFKQYQIRSNLDITISDMLSFGADLYGTNDKRTQPGVDAGFIHKQLQVNLPTRVGQYPNGLYGLGAENGANPAVMASAASGFNESVYNELRGRFFMALNLDKVTKGLSAKAIARYILSNNKGKEFNDTWTVYDYDQATGQYIPFRGFNFNTGDFLSLTDSHDKTDDQYYSVQINYDRTFDRHSIKGFVAFEQMSGHSSSFSAYKRDLISAEHPSLFAGGQEGQSSTGVESEYGRLNYFGSVSYDYRKKYLLDFTLRYDGSSVFAPDKQFGLFPGVSAGWVLSEEDFMAGSQEWMSFLKLRASWAKMGNDRVPGFQYLRQYRYGGYNGQIQNFYFFGEIPTQYNAFYNSNVPNPDITWETADSKNIGVSFAMFGDKLSGDFNYFFQKRSNILIQRNASIPDYAALQLPQENLGIVNSFGYEAELNYTNTKGELTYRVGGNFTMAENKIVYMDEAANVPEYRKQEGHPMNSFVIYPSDGLFKTQEEVDQTVAKIPGTVPGDVKYVDTDGDGKITGADQIRKYTSPVPRLQYGLSGALMYKNFELNVLLQGQGEAEIEVRYDNEGNRPAFLFEQRWTPENTDAAYPRAFGLNDTYNSRLSNVWIRNASFVRLKDMEIAYNVPENLMKFARVRVYVRGSNLLTFDHMKDLKGFDPEMSRYYNFEAGLYGPLKTYTIGANIQL